MADQAGLVPQEPPKTYKIGDCVYRRWWYHTDGSPDPLLGKYWYEWYKVDKITTKFVFVRGLMETKCIRLKRGILERTGITVSSAHSAIFVTDMPEDYRKQTIGYLLREGPRKVLDLPVDFTKEQLNSAY